MIKNDLTVILMKDQSSTPSNALKQRQGDRIKLWRTTHKMSQAELAEAVGVTKAAVSEWENGKSTPRQHIQVAIASALKTPWSALFGLDGEAA
jgi:transcriptional regulator with XRE-family HTH domain